MMRWAIPLLLISGAALADDAAFLRCRGLADAAARLACYDALPLPSRDVQPAPPRAPQPPARQTPEQFGLEGQVSARSELDAIESSIPGRFEGWQPNSRIRLANGQVWQVTDGSSRNFSMNNPKVTVRRGALGSFFLDIEGDNRSPRVKRVQ